MKVGKGKEIHFHLGTARSGTTPARGSATDGPVVRTRNFGLFHTVTQARTSNAREPGPRQALPGPRNGLPRTTLPAREDNTVARGRPDVDPPDIPEPAPKTRRSSRADSMDPMGTRDEPVDLPAALARQRQVVKSLEAQVEDEKLQTLASEFPAHAALHASVDRVIRKRQVVAELSERVGVQKQALRELDRTLRSHERALGLGSRPATPKAGGGPASKDKAVERNPFVAAPDLHPPGLRVATGERTRPGRATVAGPSFPAASSSAVPAETPVREPRQTARQVLEEGLRPRTPVHRMSFMNHLQWPIKYEYAGMTYDSLREDILDEEVHGRPVPYLTAEERKAYLVRVDDQGLLRYVQTDELVDTTSERKGRMMFVMQERGLIYVGSQRELRHHSAFLAGHPAAGAGELGVVGGKLEELDDLTGHYALPRDFTHQVESEFDSRGVDMSNVRITYRGLTREQAESVNHHGRDRLYMTGFRREYF